jgi:hypothetical protein
LADSSELYIVTFRTRHSSPPFKNNIHLRSTPEFMESISDRALKGKQKPKVGS